MTWVVWLLIVFYTAVGNYLAIEVEELPVLSPAALVWSLFWPVFYPIRWAYELRYWLRARRARRRA